jgi:threonine/homoserine/homoserine lactone efflux protein
MNTLNPAVFAIWLTWATAFVTMPVNERIVLFGSCLGVVFLADLLKVFLANRLRKKLTPTIIHRINQLSGIILIVFGVILIAGILFYKTKAS